MTTIREEATPEDQRTPEQQRLLAARDLLIRQGLHHREHSAGELTWVANIIDAVRREDGR